jgi:hypothetical protein
MPLVRPLSGGEALANIGKRTGWIAVRNVIAIKKLSEKSATTGG